MMAQGQSGGHADVYPNVSSFDIDNACRGSTQAWKLKPMPRRMQQNLLAPALTARTCSVRPKEVAGVAATRRHFGYLTTHARAPRETSQVMRSKSPSSTRSILP